METTTIQIDKHIPYVGKKHHKISGPRRKYPFPDMRVGDSFLMMPGVKLRSAQCRCSAAYREGYGRFKVAAVEENGALVLRVWKIRNTR